MDQPQDDKRTRDELLAEIETLRARIGEMEEVNGKSRTTRNAILVEEAKYLTILENLRDVIFTYNTSGVVTFITSNVSRYGYAVDDIVGKSVLEFIDASEHARVVDVIRSRIASGDEAPIEIKLVTGYGGIRVMEDYVKAVRNDDGAIINIVGILHDVTEKRENQRALEKIHSELENRVKERTQALSEAYRTLQEEVARREVAQKAQEEMERALAEEHQRLSSILDGSPVSSFVIDRDHRVTAWNMVNEYFTGISKKDILGKTLDLSSLFNNKASPALADLVLDMTDEEIITRFGLKGVNKSEIHPQAFETIGSIWIEGKEHIMAIQATRLRDGAGNVVGAIQCAEDITGQKRAEEALRESEALYRTALESSNDGVVIIRDGLFIYLNQKFLDTLGRSSDEMIGKPIGDFIMPDDRKRVIAYYEKKQRGLPTPNHIEIRTLKPDGAVMFAEVSPVEVSFEGKQSILAYIRDITDRKRVEEELQNELNKFRVLYELALNMSAEKRLEDNLTFIVEKSRQLLKTDTAYIALADDENQYVYMHILSGIRTEAFKKMKLPYGKGLGGLVMKTRQGYAIKNYFEYVGINHVVADIVAVEGVVSGMAVPIQAGERSLGVLYVFNRQITDFSKSDLDTLYLLGSLAGVEIARQKMGRELRESEAKYRTVFENSGSAMVIIEEDTAIGLANEEFVRLSGFERQELEGKKKWTEFVFTDDLPLMIELHRRRRLEKDQAPKNYEFRFIDRIGQVKDILVNVDMMPASNQSVASLMDITARKRAEAAIKQAHDDLEVRVTERTSELTKANYTLNELLQKQNVNVDIAKSIMDIINGTPSRHKEISNQADLFISSLYLPCYSEGGDHFLVKHIDDPARKARTIISLKDQSGHEVSCILRSIITDLFHNAVIAQSWDATSLEEDITRLNDKISSLDIFGAENFFTSINVDIQHSNLVMNYLAAGHPPLLLIRDGDVAILPDLQDKGRNLPIGVIGGVQFQAGTLQLQMGDKLILFTDGLMEIPCRNGLPILQYEELCGIIKGLLQRQPDLPVSRIVPALLMAVAGQEDWKQEIIETFNDDITILGLEIEDRTIGETLLFQPESREDYPAKFAEVYDRIKYQWIERGFSGWEMRLRMVLEEALANAWIHGHRQQSDRPIIIHQRYGNDAVIEVIDQGDGFNVQSQDDPTTFENRFKESGRGVYMIRLYSDDAHWKDNGRHLVACFSPADHFPRKTKNKRTIIDIWSRKY